MGVSYVLKTSLLSVRDTVQIFSQLLVCSLSVVFSYFKFHCRPIYQSFFYKNVILANAAFCLRTFPNPGIGEGKHVIVVSFTFCF